MNELRVKTSCGNLVGRISDNNDYSVFLGIRYATAGRWEYPKEVTSWEGEYKAFERNASCHQIFHHADIQVNPSEEFYNREFRDGAPITFSEDCFFLNLWVPEKSCNAPVLVYIYGGGLTCGSKDELEINGEEYAKKGVIFAAINYRVNVFGFFAHPELKKRDGYTGNYGLFDQLTALQWIQHNIESFGGDPKKISIMGQSAGAGSVQTLAASPMTDGLLYGAIMHSGHVLIPKVKMTQTVEKAYESADKVMQLTGAANFDELEQMSAEKIFKAWYETTKDQKFPITTPTIDGRLLKEDISAMFEHKDWNQLHVLCGSLRDDPMPYLFVIMSRLICKYISRRSKNPSYAFFMDREMPGSDCGTFHCADLWYSLGSMKYCWRTFEQEDYELNDLWMKYYINFIKTGNPNGDGLPVWEAIDTKQRKFMHFGKSHGDMIKPSAIKLLYRSITKQQPSP